MLDHPSDLLAAPPESSLIFPLPLFFAVLLAVLLLLLSLFLLLLFTFLLTPRRTFPLPVTRTAYATQTLAIAEHTLLILCSQSF